MKHHLPSLIFAAVAVVFLLPPVVDMVKGKPLVFSPAIAAGIGFLLAAIVAYFARRKPGGG